MQRQESKENEIILESNASIQDSQVVIPQCELELLESFEYLGQV
jgi:hypothetical protein